MSMIRHLTTRLWSWLSPDRVVCRFARLTGEDEK